MKGYALPIQFIGQMNNVAAGQTATLRLPIGAMTYHELYIVGLTSANAVVTNAQLIAEVTGQLRLIADGQDIYRITLSNLTKLQQFYGRGVASIDGAIPLRIERNTLLDARTEAALAIGTGDISSLSLELPCGTLSNVAKIAVYAKATALARPFGTHVRILETTRTYSVTGDNEDPDFSQYLRDPGVGYLAFHFPDASGYLLAGSITLRVNQIPVYDRVPGDLMAQICREDGRVPQSALVSVPFDLANLENGFIGLEGVGDFRWTLTTVGGALSTITPFVESIHNLPRAAK